MRLRNVLSLNLFIGAALLPASAFSQTWTDFQVGTTTRRALVYVPSGIEKPPLLISLHGRGIGAGWNQAGMMKFEPIADREKFVVVYPDAENGEWDLGGTKDLEFMSVIMNEMSVLHDIDLERVYASGFSMGGMFSYTLACKMPDKIAAIAPGNGYPLWGESGCVQTRSVPIFHMHGTADDFVPYSGIHDFLETKIAAYGCPTTPTTTDPYPVSDPNSKSFKEVWGPCNNGNGSPSEITLVSVAGMIHDWATAGKANTNEDPEFAGKPFDVDGSEEAWGFLKKHSLTGAVSGDGGSPGSGGSPSASGGADNGGDGGAGVGTGGASGIGGTTPSGGSGVAPAGSGDNAGTGTNSDESSGCSYDGGRPPSGHRGLAGLIVGFALLLAHRAKRRKGAPHFARQRKSSRRQGELSHLP